LRKRHGKRPCQVRLREALGIEDETVENQRDLKEVRQ
jgi:hypothetical protein